MSAMSVQVMKRGQQIPLCLVCLLCSSGSSDEVVYFKVQFFFSLLSSLMTVEELSSNISERTLVHSPDTVLRHSTLS